MARPARYGGVDLSLSQVYSGLRNAGLDHTQASNFAGVLHAESGGYTGSFYNSSTERPGALNNNGAYGLAQLNGPRQAQLLNFAGSAQAAADPQTQLNFLAQDAKNRGINLYSTSDIVNRYEVPRADLRAGEISVANANANRLSPSSYDPSLGGLSSGVANTNDPLSYTGPSGFQTAGVETSAGSEITGFKQNADGSADVELGFPGDASGNGGSGITASSFSGMNAAGAATSGSFGLSGIMSGGASVGAGNSGVAGTSVASATSGAGGSMTVPQAIDTQTRGAASDTSSLNKQSAANTDSLNKTSTANTKSATDKAQSLYNAATGSLSDYFVRLVFIIVGLIALAAALMMFKPVQNAAGAVVSKIPKVPV